MINYLLVTSKPWHDVLFEKLRKRDGENWSRIIEKEQLNSYFLKNFKPKKIFIPHWSHIIPKEIWTRYKCVVFHMTDLPYGRGGSPLQNLIVRGKKETKITALKVNHGIDEGDIYLKKPLSLSGNAREIFEKSSNIIFNMIEEIIEKKIEPYPQKGIATNFRRRLRKDGDIKNLKELNKVYDYIRMLDCEGYENAFIELKNFKIFFNNATIKNQEINANVRIIKK